MKKVLACLLLFLLPSVADSWNWDKALVRVNLATVLVSNQAETFGCTGFSINEVEGYYITAGHCVEQDAPTAFIVTSAYVKGPSPASVALYLPQPIDIAILKSNLHRPALKPRKADIYQGLPVAAIGYGYGMHMFRAGHVSQADSLWGIRRWFVVDFALIQGMSGGPIFDSRGDIVSVIQASSESMGIGVVRWVLLKETSQYWRN